MNKKGRILVADDEASLRLLLSKELSRIGYSVDVVGDGEEALKRMRDDSYQVILLDMVMPGRDGIEVLRAAKKDAIPSEVIILTGNATVENAIECMKLGAFDYVRKPYNLNELVILIERAIEHQRSQLDIRMLREELKRTGYVGKLVGKSEQIVNLRRIISRVAPTQATVLVLGESGTGKELVARSIHEESTNRNEPFVAVNCATFSENLLESELFGYEKGAFTDAKNQKRGLAEVADGGTLFLDEIGEIPLHFQAKLLRFLETGEIRRVGGTRDIKLQARIICATNKPLEKLVEQNLFRADLYYRLNVLSVSIPPLCEHLEDVPLLVEHTLSALGFSKQFDENAMRILKAYRWPGNVRELRNVIERTCILTSGNVVDARDLSFLDTSGGSVEVRGEGGGAAEVDFDTTAMTLKEMERRHIINVLKHVDGHKGKAARLLEINPKTLYYKMRNYNIISTYK